MIRLIKLKIMHIILSIIMITICIAALCFGHTGSGEQGNALSDYKTENDEKNSLHDDTGDDSGEMSDYRPMICVNNNLYVETGRVFESISEKTAFLGTIQKLVPQNEAMIKEEFTSNAMPPGSEIYADETESEIIYIKYFHKSTEKDVYAEYEILI